MMAAAGVDVSVIAAQLWDTIENARIYTHISASRMKAGVPGITKLMRKSKTGNLVS